MPCFRPRRAWSLLSGGITFREPFPLTPATPQVQVPCGGCVGCRSRRALSWTIRCRLELTRHSAATFVTLTYETAPPQLVKDHLTAFIKRLRSKVRKADSRSRRKARKAHRAIPDWRRIKFFGCGEYGDKNGRPHYHLLVFGLPPGAPEITRSWSQGFITSTEVTPARVAYCAGYVTKKLEHASLYPDLIDLDTGELLAEGQKPFLLMSRRPAIASDFKQYWSDYSESAVIDGKALPVPRYLHNAFLNNASTLQLLKHDLALHDRIKSLPLDHHQRLNSGETIAKRKLSLAHSKRTL
ncbi:MAG: replication initiator protein [Microvirus sp.]|nr:MAG: replication initiator protein [Microvirus sp.]